jgi:hypothetical protein
MSKEKQIEEIDELEMVLYEANHKKSVLDYRWLATEAYNAGYRKQSEGEWIKDEESKFEHRYHCSVCNFYLIGEPTKYCEDCGAKMKGGAE